MRNIFHPPFPPFRIDQRGNKIFSPQLRAVLPRVQVINLPPFYASYRFSNWKTREPWFLSVFVHGHRLSTTDLLLPGYARTLLQTKVGVARARWFRNALCSSLHFTNNPEHIPRCRQRRALTFETLAETRVHA